MWCFEVCIVSFFYLYWQHAAWLLLSLGSCEPASPWTWLCLWYKRRLRTVTVWWLTSHYLNDPCSVLVWAGLMLSPLLSLFGVNWLPARSCSQFSSDELIDFNRHHHLHRSWYPWCILVLSKSDPRVLWFLPLQVVCRCDFCNVWWCFHRSEDLDVAASAFRSVSLHRMTCLSSCFVPSHHDTWHVVSHPLDGGLVFTALLSDRSLSVCATASKPCAASQTSSSQGSSRRCLDLDLALSVIQSDLWDLTVCCLTCPYSTQFVFRDIGLCRPHDRLSFSYRLVLISSLQLNHEDDEASLSCFELAARPCLTQLFWVGNLLGI